MASETTRIASSADVLGPLPEVRLELRQPGGRAVEYALTHVDFLIGTVPGCDLRLSGAEVPGVICLFARRPGGLSLRKLAPTLSLFVNGRPVSSAELADGDRVALGSIELLVHVDAGVRALPFASDARTDELDLAKKALNEAVTKFRAQVGAFQQGKIDFENAQQKRADEFQERAAALEGREKRLQEGVARLEAEQNRWRLTRGEADREFSASLAKLQGIEQREQAAGERLAVIEKQQQDLARDQRQYQSDVVRLHRLQGDLEQREADLRTKCQELEDHGTRLRQESAELETQLLQCDEWRTRLTDQDQRLAARQQELETHAGRLDQRAAALEGQQATLAGLRSRLERLRDEMRIQQTQLDSQRHEQDEARTVLASAQREEQQLRRDVDADRRLFEEERREFSERSAVLEAAVHQLRQTQERLAGTEQRQSAQAMELEARAAHLAEEEGLLEGRRTQLAHAQERLEAERQLLRERSVALLQGEQAREALQEQLRRRSEELAVQKQSLQEQAEAQARVEASFQEQKTQIDSDQAASWQRLTAIQEELNRKAVELDKRQLDLAGFDERYRKQLDQLGGERRAFGEERALFHRERQATLEAQAHARAELESLRLEARGLAQQLPEVELRTQAALDRLGDARTQLRDHLAEIHQYVRQCQADLEQAHARVKTDDEKLRQDEQALARHQDEHRLSMVGFRQHLIDWQGQVGEMKRSLAQGETRLERKHAQVEERASEVDDTSKKLAERAGVLDEQQRVVADRRQEIDRHLVDLREWYRVKLRELAGASIVPGADPHILPLPAMPVDESDDAELVPTGRHILALTGPKDQGDQKLGELLGALRLVDADTLTALLAQARRQRRSLRQVLLASGAVTLFQLALIEAGKLDNLVLGPVRVIDRLRSSPHEIIYRVFDPRRGAEAVLRHLAEAEMLDAVRPDEYRQRFAQAVMSDPHLAGTLEVLDLQGRPAVLQEWLTGLPATDWPPLAAAPGVCYRLLTQAALGLASAHQAGLVHGHLGEALLLLTGEGVLKVCGLGEPPWLFAQSVEQEPSVRDDLRALGTIVSLWCTTTGVRRGAKAKPLPDALVSVLYRLAAEGDAGYASAAELLADLESAGRDVPANTEAWERLLKYVREHGTPDAVLRRSA